MFIVQSKLDEIKMELVFIFICCKILAAFFPEKFLKHTEYKTEAEFLTL